MSLTDFLRGTNGVEGTGVGDCEELTETLVVRSYSSLGKEPLDINGKDVAKSELKGTKEDGVGKESIEIVAELAILGILIGMTKAPLLRKKKQHQLRKKKQNDLQH